MINTYVAKKIISSLLAAIMVFFSCNLNVILAESQRAASNNAYDGSSGIYNNSSGSYDNSSGNYNNSSGNYDSSSGNYDNSSGNYDNSSGNYNNSSGNYDNSSGNYDNSSGNYNPKPNSAPILNHIGDLTINEGELFKYKLSATDVDGDQLYYQASYLPPGAHLTSDGLFSWQTTISDGRNWPYYINFRVSDGSSYDSEYVAVTVINQNQAPVITQIVDYIIIEKEYVAFNIQATDPDNDWPLTFSSTNLPSGAYLSPYGWFFWQPTDEQAGIYDIDVNVSDGMLSDTDDFRISVNNYNKPPVFQYGGIYDYASEGSIFEYDAIATDPEGEPLHYFADTLPIGAILNPQTGAFSWAPDYNQAGLYNLIIKVTDGTSVASATLTINVTNTNRIPIFEPLGNKIINENSNLSFKVQATDIDNDPLVYSSFWLPDGAIFNPLTQEFSWTPSYSQGKSYPYYPMFFVSDGYTMNSQQIGIKVDDVNKPPVFSEIDNKVIDEKQLLEFNVSATDPEGESITYSAKNLPTWATFDKTNAKFTWQPSYFEAGDYEVDFIANDGTYTTTKRVSIKVNNLNRPPRSIYVAGNTTVNEGQKLNLGLIAADDDYDPLVFSAENLPEGAVFNDRYLVWTPNYNQAGTYVIRFSASDGQASISTDYTVTVKNVNRPPVFNPIDVKNIDEGQLLTFGLEANDPDVDDNLVYSATGLPQGATLSENGLFSWKPSYDQAGDYIINVTASDSGSLNVSQQIKIKVVNKNRLPVLATVSNITINEGQNVIINPLVSDADADTLTVSYSGWMTSSSYTTNYNDAGNHIVRVTVSDGQDSVYQDVNITVNNVNRSPVFNLLEDKTVNEKQKLEFNVSGYDFDSDNLTYSASGLPVGATISNTGTFTWTPTYYQSGSYAVTFYISDGVDVVSKTINITVNNLKVASSISIYSNLSTFKKGQIIIIKGTLKGDDGALLTGRPVKLKANGVVIADLKTNSKGVYYYSLKPNKSTTFQASFAGGTIYNASVSKKLTVNFR